MRRDVPSGILLILSAVITIVVMHMHPVSHHLMDSPDSDRTARLNVLVHGAAIASVPMLLLGLWGLARRLAPSGLTIPALVAHAMAGVASICAAVMSGFVATDVIRRMPDVEPAARGTWDALLTYTGMINQGFATVLVFASSAAILLWALAIVRTGRLSRVVAIAGLVIGALVPAAFLAGLVGLDVRGFGLIVVVQSVWLAWVGVLLLQGSSTPVSQ